MAKEKKITCEDLLNMTDKEVSWTIVSQSKDFVDGFILGQQFCQGKIKRQVEELFKEPDSATGY